MPFKIDWASLTVRRKRESLIVILRSGCIASLTALNYNLKDHLKKFTTVSVIFTPLYKQEHTEQ